MTRPRALTLPLPARRAIVAHARRDAPNECCGLLLGRGRQVRLALPMANVDPDPAARYRVGDREHIAVRRVVRRLKPAMEIVGVYHSHPHAEPAPSASDLSEANYPEWVYLIVGLASRHARIAAYEIARGRARRIPVRPDEARRRRRGR